MPSFKHSEKDLEEAVRVSFSYANVLRLLNMKQSGGNHTYVSSRVKRLKLNTAHFTGKGYKKFKPSGNRKSSTEILILLQEGSMRTKPYQLRRALKERGLEEVCLCCGLGVVWNNSPIQLEIDHINNNWLDNRFENLQYLCPNCHTQKTNMVNP